ncbi:MAG: thioredoxin domain-containing protein [Spirosomataceae bacterium]
MNHLQQETSPYLLQHAHNPVDWFPWGEDALQKAKSENKPIIVSIGYSACHWCHVMERESFENQQIADVMNRDFVCIKVDREERPDIDAIYMDAVQAMGIRGGWPLNVFLLPNGKPFYGGTYFPPRNWVNVCSQIANAFINHYDELAKSAEGFTENMRFSETAKYGLEPGEKVITESELATAFEKFSQQFDAEWGGMSRAPKFPMPCNWSFALRYYALTNHPIALSHTLLTLEKMALGGIYDQLGGGFARYSTDGEWFLPHFEKMLYDNGQLMSLYAEAYTITKDSFFANVIDQTFQFVKNYLTSPEFGFYAAYDADSEGEEGKYYVWTKAEIEAITGNDTAWFCDYYQVTAEGNYFEEASHHATGTNILYPNQRWETFATKHQLTDEHYRRFKAYQQQLLEKRSQRVLPGLDDKVLASWNGLMIKGLADAYRATNQHEYLALALKNAHFVRSKLTKGYQLWHSYKNGQAKIMSFLEDYAAIIDAYIALYEVTFDEQWLAFAESHTIYVWEHFWDTQDQLFYFTDNQAEQLIARKKEFFDNVIPSSNSMMIKNLYFLGLLLSREDFVDTALHVLSKVKSTVKANPDYLANWASVATSVAKPTAEVVIVGPQFQEIRAAIEQEYLPNKVILGSRYSSTLPLFAGRTAPSDETRIYVCFNQTCQLPVKTAEEALALIKGREFYS